MINKEIYVGDNLKVMTKLIESGRHDFYKAEYIDPPYNTHTKKSYNDGQNRKEWLTFMKERLLCAKVLLRNDGVIFISIDDNEYAYLKVLCDEVFGEDNCLGTFITKQSQRSNAKHINTIHEYVLAYAKDKSKVKKLSVLRTNIPEQKEIIDKMNAFVKGFDGDMFQDYSLDIAREKLPKFIQEICSEYNVTWPRNYSLIDDEGEIYFPTDLSTPGTPRTVDIPEINLHLDPLPTRGWSSDKKFVQLYHDNRLVFKDGRPYAKHYLYESEDNVTSILDFYSRQGTKDLKDLGIDGLFDTPKPVVMLKFLLRLIVEDGDYILDFFGGSGSTAQAVYELEDEMKINLGYTLIQLNEKAKDPDVLKACEKYNVKPLIPEIMIFRLRTFLKIKNKKEDFIIYA